MTINCLSTLLTLIKSRNVVAKGWAEILMLHRIPLKDVTEKKKKSGVFINTKARNQLKREKSLLLHV
jgi:hypothetical protein